jgi:F0F1-type ATP synthase gamma subunit
MSFMDRMSNMLRASANVGKVVSQLRGQISRSEQAIEVAYRGRG